MDSTKDVSITKHSALNPNAAEFFPSALRAANAGTNNSVVRKPGLSDNNDIAGTTKSNSSISSIDNDPNQQDWQFLLPDDIIPEFDISEHDTMGVQSFEDENKVDPLELLAIAFPGFSKESLEHLYFANGGDFNFTIETLHEMEHQDNSDPQWESSMHFISGHKMDPDVGTGRSAQFPPKFALDRVVANGNRLQTSSVSQRLHQQPSEVAVNAGQTVGTSSLYSNLGEQTRDPLAQNAYFKQARKANFPGRDLIPEGQWHDGNMAFSSCKEGELVYGQRDMAFPQLHNGGARYAKEINLQGYDVNEAIQQLKNAIAVLRDISWQTGHPLLLSVNVGLAQTIQGHGAAAGLAVAVERYLVENEKLNCSVEHPGILQEDKELNTSVAKK